MKIHRVKSWPEYFDALSNGKNFELRKNDRRYQVGDELVLQEYDDRAGKLTGRELRRRITYVLEGVGYGSITPLQGLSRDYAILALEPLQ